MNLAFFISKCYIFSVIFLLLWICADADTFTNPIAQHGPDPWMLYHNGFYYLTTTTAVNKVTMRKSKTVAGLYNAQQNIIYQLNNPTDVMWAPEFHLLGDKWYLYYTNSTPNDIHRINVLESAGTDPMGPYQFKADLSDPNVTDELDPSVIQIDGKLYLIGSCVGTDKPMNQSLFIRPMSSPWQTSGPRVVISRPQFNWEYTGAAVNEGPVALHHNGRHFIIYSASFCDTPDYKLGLLTFNGSDPLNKAHWHKSGPVFQRNDTEHVFGPGHNGFFMSPDAKENWIVYHANDDAVKGKCDMNRSTRIQKFTWNEDGTPNFGIPAETKVALQAPSG